MVHLNGAFALVTLGAFALQMVHLNGAFALQMVHLNGAFGLITLGALALLNGAFARGASFQWIVTPGR
jgi:hypothetical protein